MKRRNKDLEATIHDTARGLVYRIEKNPDEGAVRGPEGQEEA